MKHLNFYKARSRFGITHTPYHGTGQNAGVEDGPDAVLSDTFLSAYHDSNLYSYIYPDPQVISPAAYMERMAYHSKEFASMITQNEKDYGGISVVVGGDHSIAYASILAQLSLHSPNDIGMIQFDTHGDINLVSESPSGNFHGMHMRALTDPNFDNHYLRDIPNLLSTDNLLYVGNLDLDPGEKAYIQARHIRTIDRNEIENDAATIHAEIQTYIARFRHLHISFDIDVFDKTIVSATGTPSENGLFEDDIFPILKRLPKTNISVDLVEVNPQKPDAQSTIDLGQKVLSAILNL
jgi:arginase